MWVCEWWVGVLQPHVCDNVKHDIKPLTAAAHWVKTERLFLISIRRWTRDNICKSEPSLVKHLTLLKDLDSSLAIWKQDVVKLSNFTPKQYFFFWFWSDVWPEDGKSLMYGCCFMLRWTLKISNQCFGFCVILRTELKNTSSVWNFNMFSSSYTACFGSNSNICFHNIHSDKLKVWLFVEGYFPVLRRTSLFKGSGNVLLQNVP